MAYFLLFLKKNSPENKADGILLFHGGMEENMKQSQKQFMYQDDHQTKRRGKIGHLLAAAVMTVCLVMLSTVCGFGSMPEQSADTGTDSDKILTAGDTDLAPNCKAAILYEATTGTVLFAKNEDMQLPPASMTKVMTAILVLEENPQLEGTLTVDKRAVSPYYCSYMEPPSNVRDTGFEYETTNRVKFPDDRYESPYSRYMTGVKTGYTPAAGYCFSGCMERNGLVFYSVAMGGNERDNGDGRILQGDFVDTINLYRLTDGLTAENIRDVYPASDR